VPEVIFRGGGEKEGKKKRYEYRKTGFKVKPAEISRKDLLSFHPCLSKTSGERNRGEMSV